MPADYRSTQKQYPVLYMQDGQNIFDSWQTLSGEWNVDETLDRFFYDSKQMCYCYWYRQWWREKTG
ncbi:MAG: hypothetical protein HC867_05055 [Bacteroidia bacterium]|nr:hypothetical protein [Bacteroidia bacterium]